MEFSQLRQTAQKFLDGYNAWTADAILATRAPDCQQRVHPSRLNRPYMGNDEYRTYFTSQVQPYFTEFHVEAIEFTEDEKNHRVSVHAKSTAKSVIGPYANEYVIMLQMTNDDKQVTEIKEFVDSGFSAEFFGRLKEVI